MRAGLVALAFLAACGVAPRASAQGAAVPTEMATARAALTLIGESAMVRGVITRVLGTEAAEALLALPAPSLGARVVGDDVLAGAVAHHLSQGSSKTATQWLADVNSLRLADPPPLTAGNRLSLLSERPAGVFHKLELAPATAAPAPLPKAAPPGGREVAFTPEGIKMQPGFSVPLWTAKPISGVAKIDTLKWSTIGKGGTLACTAVEPCRVTLEKKVETLLATPEAQAKTPP